MSKEKVYWMPDKLDEQQGLCTLNATNKLYRCYVKWEGGIHFFFYDDGEYNFNCDASTDYGADTRRTTHYQYYWHIGDVEDLDKAIAQLQSIKAAAAEWYAKRGKQWPPDWDAVANGEKTLKQALTLEQESEQ